MHLYTVTFYPRQRAQREEYSWNTLVAAEEHLGKFVEDTSNLYEKIVLTDDKDTVLHVLVFADDGRVKHDIFLGMPVRLQEVFCGSAQEHERIYAVENINEVTSRCVIRCVNTGLPIAPTEIVGFEMVQTCAKLAQGAK